MKFTTAYTNLRPRKSFDCTGVSLTKQSSKQECDINHLLKRYQKTGLIDHVNQHHGNYDNLIDTVDYHTAQNTLIQAEQTFQSLPSSIRKKFNNDPASFVDFVLDENNIDEMVKMGLSKKPAEVVLPDPPATEPNPEPTT